MLHDATKFDQFAAMVDSGCNIVAVQRSLFFDHQTVLALAGNLRDHDPFFLLESATSGPQSISRYSFLGFDPLWEVVFKDGALSVGSPGQLRTCPLQGEDPLTVIGREFSKFRLAPSPLPNHPLSAQGGAVGWLNFDLAAWLEPSIGRPPPKQIGLPEAYLFIPKGLIVVDQLTKTACLIHYHDVSDCRDCQESFADATAYLEAMEHKVRQTRPLDELQVRSADIDWDRYQGTVAEQPYLDLVEECLEHIRSGDVFQIQVGNRLSAQVQRNPFDLFRHLRILNPSPYMFFLRRGEDHILGASPEMMVNVQAGHVTHRPIAGTRRRYWDLVKDTVMKAELTESEKERAEHVMLVDLSRNDIGRISEIGRVKVDELLTVEEYSHVFHMVSQVRGELRPELTAFDAMRASFPAGTVSGAPKIKAMELIYRYEPCAREYYAGSMALFSFDGGLKSTLLIRSMHVANHIASTQASAGIVYDSIPRHEWAETRHKMSACVTVMQNALSR